MGFYCFLERDTSPPPPPHPARPLYKVNDQFLLLMIKIIVSGGCMPKIMSITSNFENDSCHIFVVFFKNFHFICNMINFNHFKNKNKISCPK